MGGVDLGDQLRGSYYVRLKNKINYKYIFCFLFDVAIRNAYILHSCDLTTAAMDRKSFRIMLAKQLIGDYMRRKAALYRRARWQAHTHRRLTRVTPFLYKFSIIFPGVLLAASTSQGTINKAIGT